ncbi:MAG: glutamate 5-kinase [Myxococcota bacterium]
MPPGFAFLPAQDRARRAPVQQDLRLWTCAGDRCCAGVHLAVVELRQALKDVRRVVVKIGSRALAGVSAEKTNRFAAVASEIAAQREAGRQAVVVSSGAIAFGRERLGMTARPSDMPRLQAAAAAGQSQLVRRWEEAFEAFSLPVAQVLLTHADLTDRDRYLNVRRSLDALLELGAIPIINENDTVSVEEIRFGDNDQLAAMVATLVGADLLVLLTDVDGVMDDSGARIAAVRDLDEVTPFIRKPEGDVGLGGMASKLEAARRAARRGVPVVIAKAEANVLSSVLRGDDIGTLLLPHGAKLASRKHWIAYTLRPRGEVLIDEGAAKALRKRASLLAAGVVGVRGAFEAGDAVRLMGPAGEVARGLVRYGLADVAKAAGAQSSELEEGAVIVHRDDLVVTEGE